jgi:hypothetical protein
MQKRDIDDTIKKSWLFHQESLVILAQLFPLNTFDELGAGLTHQP